METRFDGIGPGSRFPGASHRLSNLMELIQQARLHGRHEGHQAAHAGIPLEQMGQLPGQLPGAPPLGAGALGELGGGGLAPHGIVPTEQGGLGGPGPALGGGPGIGQAPGATLGGMPQGPPHFPIPPRGIIRPGEAARGIEPGQAARLALRGYA